MTTKLNVSSKPAPQPKPVEKPSAPPPQKKTEAPKSNPPVQTSYKKDTFTPSPKQPETTKLTSSPSPLGKPTINAASGSGQTFTVAQLQSGARLPLARSGLSVVSGGGAPVVNGTGGTGGGTTSPEVQAAVDEINEYPADAQGQGLTTILNQHSSNSPEDVAFRQELMQTLGPDRVAQMTADLGEYAEYDGATRVVLSAAAESFPPAGQAQVVQALGSEVFSRVVAFGLDGASDPMMDAETSARVRGQMENIAGMMGDIYSLPDGSPGKAEMMGALERIQNGEELDLGEMPGASATAWLVSRSGNDQMRMDIANQYLDAYKADPTSLAPEEARAVAWMLGSVEDGSLQALDSVMSMTQEQRQGFLSAMTTSEYLQTPDFNTGALFQQDAVGGVNEFLLDVARINPVNYPNAEAARNFRIETFQAVTRAVDGEFFSDNGTTHNALASMFAADVDGIVSASSDTASPYYDREGHTLAKFFDHVAFRDEGTRETVTNALKNYLGVGSADGIVDALSANQGNTEFMRGEGNVLAVKMGFVLGALYQGAQSGLANIDDEYARQKAVVSVLGGVAEELIKASPVATAYNRIKAGSGNRASVTEVFNWLATQFIGSPDAGKDAVRRLAGSLIEGAWDPFFSNASLTGANPQELEAMFTLINAGVSRADGIEGQPSINIGGSTLPTR
jgi:hypothetical protein